MRPLHTAGAAFMPPWKIMRILKRRGGIYAALVAYIIWTRGRINAPSTYRTVVGAAFMPPWSRTSSEPGAH